MPVILDRLGLDATLGTVVEVGCGYGTFSLLFTMLRIILPSKRRELENHIATGNWEAIIVTHSGFEKIPCLPNMRQCRRLRQKSMVEAQQ